MEKTSLVSHPATHLYRHSPVTVQAQSRGGEQTYQDAGLQAADTEMRILEASIDKISELLAVAFGDAGVNIIAENMRCMGGLDPMVPGNRTVRPLLHAAVAVVLHTAVVQSRQDNFHCKMQQ